MMNSNSTVQDKSVELVIEKIQKLLALASNNTSQQEAINATRKAHELMARYNLTQIDVRIDKSDINEIFCHVGTAKSWKYRLADIVANNFCTKAYFIGSDTIVFYGRTHDIKISQDVYMFLFKTCEKLAKKEYRKRKGEKDVYYWYTRGFLQGVEDGLAEQCRALMIVTPPEVEESYFKKVAKFEELSKSKETAGRKSLLINYSALKAGMQDGCNAVSTKKLEKSSCKNFLSTLGAALGTWFGGI